MFNSNESFLLNFYEVSDFKIFYSKFDLFFPLLVNFIVKDIFRYFKISQNILITIFIIMDFK